MPSLVLAFVAVAITCQLSGPRPAPPPEPLQPHEDPAIIAGLGPLYVELVRARKDVDAGLAKVPVRSRPRVGPKLLESEMGAVGERWKFGRSRLDWVAKLGVKGRWPATGPEIEPTEADISLAQEAYRAAERANDVETRHYTAERDLKDDLEGRPRVGESISAEEFDRQLARSVSSPVPKETRCDAANRLGRPCSRLVPNGGRCWVHRGAAPIVPAP